MYLENQISNLMKNKLISAFNSQNPVSANQTSVIAKNPQQQFVKFVQSPQQTRVEQQSTGRKQQPTSGNQQSTSGKQQPTSGNQQPTAKNQQQG